MNDADVIVVGGGPAGASTAFALATAGVKVVVVDRERFPRDKPCAEYLSPQASRVLHDMGVLAELESRGPSHLAGMIVRAPSGRQLRGDFAAQHGFRGFRDRGLAASPSPTTPARVSSPRPSSSAPTACAASWGGDWGSFAPGDSRDASRWYRIGAASRT